ncbi:MAG: 30S ribosomal protein S1 [Chloroflexi bacterium]|nr:30S ribosomal protein S1 [Chloroflexota bacterium]
MSVQTVTAPDGTEIKRKMHFVGKVIKTTTAGAIVDIGINKPAVVHISQLREEPVKKVEDVVKVGDEVDVWVRRITPKGIVELTMIKPLDLEWREIKKGMVVKGKVERIEKYGVFVNIGAEVPGLVHISEMTHGFIRSPRDLVQEGDEVEAKVIAVSRRKRQIKLSMKALEPKPEEIMKEVNREPRKAKKAASGANGGSKAAAAEDYVPTPMEMALLEALKKARAEMESSSGKARTEAKKKVQELEALLSKRMQAQLN